MPDFQMSSDAKEPPMLSDFGLDPQTGFLPFNPPPLRRLPAYFEPWETILDHLNPLLVAGVLRNRISKLPVLDVKSHLATKAQWLRAYTVLTMLAQSHIMGIPKADAVDPILPECIAKPWWEVSKELDLQPVISYTGVALNNWYLIDPEGPANLSNMSMQHLFSGVFDEAWFYLIPLAIEAAGGSSIQGMVDAQRAILNSDKKAFSMALKRVADSVESMIPILKRMYEKNDPHIFWNRVRLYSGGSKNSSTLPNGLFYEGVTEKDEFVNHNAAIPQGKVGTWRFYPGASAGQSPLIHSLDIGLDIHHKAMHSKIEGDSASRQNPMLEMRKSLSLQHRAFLTRLGEGPSIREHVSKLNPSDEAAIEFNRAINALTEFRSTHIQMASLYIVLQQKKSANAGSDVMNNEVVVGTGGTDLIPFLKQTRQETIEAKLT